MPELKAWHVWQGDPWDGSLLVFAYTRNQARLRGFMDGPWEWDEYVHTRSIRAKDWDEHADRVRVIETNDDLPEGAKPFYDDDETWPP